MNAKLSMFTLIMAISLTMAIASADYPPVVDNSSSTAGIGPQINPNGSYTFIVEAPSGVFTSVTLILNGQSYPMTYDNGRWTVTVANVSAGSLYHYQIVTASGVVFNGSVHKI